MLNFTSALTTAYKKDYGESYWLLRLYYDDESSFTGFSNKPREVSSNVYYEALNLGRHSQRGEPDKFIVSNGTINVILPNTPKSCEGSRLSDLFLNRKYTNRKWEIYQCRDDVAFSTDNLLASGIIGADFNYDDLQFSIYLNDWWILRNDELPSRKITKDIYANAPEKNLGKSIPMWYGDFDVISDVPASSDFERHYVKGKVPALIVFKVDLSGKIQVLADTDQDSEVILNQLNAKNVFLFDQVYQACDDANVTLTANPTIAANNIIKFTGTEFYAYVVFARDLTTGLATITNPANMFDEDRATSGNMSCIAGGTQDMDVEVGDVKNTGQATNVEVLAFFGTFTGNPDSGGGGGVACFYVFKTGANVFFDWDGASYQSLDMGQYFDDVNMEGMTLAGLNMSLFIDDSSNNGGGDVDIKEVGIQIKVTSNKSYIYDTIPSEVLYHGTVRPHGQIKAHHRAIIKPGQELKRVEAEVVFISGKGREYGSWIDADSRNNGYNQGNLIENPVYIIEDILRNELGLTSSEIDYTAFDVAGNTTNGTIGDVFNDAVSDIKFAFSQYQITNTKTLIRKICELSGLYFYWSAGKAKVKARKQIYSAVDDTIDFRNVAYPSPQAPNTMKPKVFLTNYDDIINYLTINFDYDYGSNQTIQSIDENDNAGLKDDTSLTNYSADGTKYLKGVTTFDLTLDQTTAEKYGVAQISWFKDRKRGIEIEITKGIYNHLEIGDAVNIDNFPTDFKVFGDEIASSDVWLIIEKTVTYNGCIFKLIKVPGAV